MTDFDIESAVTAGLQAANDHTALDAEWLRKFTRGVLAHHLWLPPSSRAVTFGGVTFMADASLPDDVAVIIDTKGERTAFSFPKAAPVTLQRDGVPIQAGDLNVGAAYTFDAETGELIDEERPLTAEERAMIGEGWADYVEAAAKNGPRDDA